MKILFSPSEAKNSSSSLAEISENSFIFKELYNERLKPLKAYNDFVNTASLKDLEKFFELKKEDDILAFKGDIFKAKTSMAITRYSGVSYKYLDFASLDESAKEYVKNNTIIFSNLFGPILAKDSITNYKFKQGAKLNNEDIANFYKKTFSKALDEFLQDEQVLDLRASFYDKFYVPSKKFYTYKFFKDKKVLSHFAKAYRGLLLRIMAQNQVESNEALLSVLPKELRVIDIKDSPKKTEVSIEILS